MGGAAVPEVNVVGAARARRRLITALASTTGAATVAHAAMVALGDRVSGPLRDVAVFNIPYLVAFVALVWAAHHARLRGREWRAWAWFAAGFAAQLAANVYYTLVLTPMTDPPYPSWSDVGYLVFYPEVYIGLILLARSRIAHWRPSLWWDGMITYLAVAAIVVQVALQPMVALAGGRLEVALVNLAYPLGDTVLLAMIVGSAVLLGAHFDRQWLLLGLGMASMAVADLAYSVLDSAGLYFEGHPADIGFALSATLIAMGALREVGRGPVAPHEVASGRIARWALVAAPTGAGVMALAVLAPVQAWPRVDLAQWLALMALAAATSRVLLSYHEVEATSTARKQANTDELTGLINRRGFIAAGDDVVAQVTHLADTGRAIPGVALLLLDLNGFKDVNDSLGHATGDRLLIEVARRLRTALRNPDDVLARLGGDEFAAVLASADLPTAIATADRIRTALARPVTLGAIPLRIEASIGISVAPEHGTDLTTLLSRADIAMYRAKSRGLGHATFDPTHGDHDEERRLADRTALRHALATGVLVPTWHQVATLTDHQVATREIHVALHAPGTDLDPDALTRTATALRLLPEVTTATLDVALREAATWTDDPPVPITVTIPAEALNPGLVEHVTALLARHHLPAERLVLKVGEDALFADRDRATLVLAQMHTHGVRWCLDGFGAQESVLGFLATLPIGGLTLHTDLVAPALIDPAAADLLRTVAALAHQLDVAVTADLTDTPSSAHPVIADLGCDLGRTPAGVSQRT